MIDEYADSLSAKLAFDPELAKRVRDEVADHLYETASAIDANDRDREALAIARFGHADSIVRDLAAIAWKTKLRYSRNILFLAVSVVFISMRVRSYCFDEYVDEIKGAGLLGTAISCIDKYAFILAIMIAVTYFLLEKWGDRLLSDQRSLLQGELSFFAVISGVVLIDISAIAGTIIVSKGILDLTTMGVPILDVTASIMASLLVVLSLVLSVFVFKMLVKFFEMRAALSVARQQTYMIGLLP